MSMTIGIIFIEILIGLVVGVSSAFLSWLFKFLELKPFCIYLKALFCIIFSIGFVVASELSSYSNAQYLACLSFGYVCSRFWNEKKPSIQVGFVIWCIVPILFGSVGASFLFS